MSIFDKAIGVVIGDVANAADQFIQTDDEKAAFHLKLEEMRQRPELLVLEERIKQAEHPDLFVAGARPATIWIGNAGIAMAAFIAPLLNWLGAMLSPDTFVPIPALDWEVLLTLVGVTGWGTLMRSRDKKHGVARNNIRGVL